MAQQFAVAGAVDPPIRSALARAMSAASSSYGSDAGASSDGESDADEGSGRGSDLEEGPDAAAGMTRSPVLQGLAVAASAASATPRLSLTSRRSSRTARPPGWVTDTAGTFAFLAPEACGSSGGYDAFRADLWAAGVCFYAMLFGRAPFGRSADNPLSLFEAIQVHGEWDVRHLSKPL